MFGLLNIILTFTSCNNAVVYLTLTVMTRKQDLLNYIINSKATITGAYLLPSNNVAKSNYYKDAIKVLKALKD